MKKSILFLINFCYSFIVILIIIFASLLKTDEITPHFLFGIKNLDKIVHIVMYFTLTLTIAIESIFYREQITKYTLLLFAFISIIFGIIMEASQYIFTTYRSFDVIDMLFNILGTLIALLVALLALNSIKKMSLIKWMFEFKKHYNSI